MADEAPRTQLHPPVIAIGYAIVPGSVNPEATSDATAPVFHAVVGEMLLQSFTPDDIGKVGGGKYCCVFGKITAGSVACLREST